MPRAAWARAPRPRPVVLGRRSPWPVVSPLTPQGRTMLLLPQSERRGCLGHPGGVRPEGLGPSGGGGGWEGEADGWSEMWGRPRGTGLRETSPIPNTNPAC